MYFNQNVIVNKNWVPNIVCKSCYNRLMDWKNRRRESMPFGIPMTWTNPGEGHNPLNCYACANKGDAKRIRKSYNYVAVASAATTLPHLDHIPVRKASSPDIFSSTTAPTYHARDDPPYEPSVSNEPILINQNKLDSIVAKLELTQHKSEELASILKSNNLLEPGVKVTAYRSRQATLQSLFLLNDEKTSAYCRDVGKFMDAMEIKYDADDWRLFIDSSKLSLKAVLLHKTNKKPSVPIAYSTETKETYDALKNILKMVNYAKHMCRICCDLKVVAMLCGLQSGYIKYMCFLCDWDTRFSGDQYACHGWKLREHSRLQTANIIREPLVHIKLGIVKNVIKTVAKRDEVFLCLKLIYPRLSESKIKEGFVYGNHQKTDTQTGGDNVDGLTLIPSEPTVVRYTNESLIVLCRSPTPDVKLHWMSPKGEIIEEHKGRIHIEPSSKPEELKLVFMHISLADKGNWSCEDTTGGKTKKVFDLMVFQKITFTENTTILTVKEGQNATILCEVKGEPQPNITWHFNGLPISVDINSTKFRILGDGLLINTVTQNDTGEYTCRAYQVNPIASDMQERTVLMKIEHKPMWIHPEDKKDHYSYLNGTATLKCEAVAEPPGNFTWYRYKKQIHNDKHYTIENENYISILHIKAGDESVFSTYKCKIKNHLGSIERTYLLKEGIKPPTPHPIQLRGLNSHTFDIELSVTRSNTIKPLMEVNGYRIEYMSEMEFKKDSGKWLNAKRKDFNYESGATFLLNNLEPNTTYLVRAASRNEAGLSDWTKVEKFRTQFIPLSTSSSNVVACTHIVCFILVALFLSQELTFGASNANRIINFPCFITWYPKIL